MQLKMSTGKSRSVVGEDDDVDGMSVWRKLRVVDGKGILGAREVICENEFFVAV